MKKTVLTILIAGVAMNAYGTDQEGDVKGGYSRLPLSDTSNRSEGVELDMLYPECSQYIQYEKDESRKVGIEKGRQQERLKSVRRMLAKGLSDADINELADLKEGELDQIKARLKDVK